MTDPQRPAGASGEQALHDHTDIAVRKYAVPADPEFDVLSADTRFAFDSPIYPMNKERTMREITFILGPERAAAEIWEVLGQAEITLEASCTYPTVDGRNVRLVVADSDITAAKAAALEAGFGPIDENEVLLAEIEIKAGSLGALARRVADTGAKLQILYMARGGRVVVGADDLEKAASVV